MYHACQALLSLPNLSALYHQLAMLTDGALVKVAAAHIA